MTKKSFVKVFLFSLITALILLPIYLFWDLLILGFKFLNPDFSKLKSDNKTVSILVLGKGGADHEAPDLTDTIMNIFLSVEDKSITLLSLPRDLWIPETRAKLNSSYYWGKQKTGNGLVLSAESVEGVTDIKPSYVVVIDFSLFKDLIDTLGGIDVEVENSFVDDRFPIKGQENNPCIPCRYETISFEKGIQKMDGETALKFVRSRNSGDEEGTDLAREVRQQKILGSLKNKLTSSATYANPKLLLSLVNTIVLNLETDIDIPEAVILTRLIYDSRNNLKYLSIPESFLTVSNGSPKYDFLYVFIPSEGNWKTFQEWLKQRI